MVTCLAVAAGTVLAGHGSDAGPGVGQRENPAAGRNLLSDALITALAAARPVPVIVDGAPGTVLASQTDPARAAGQVATRFRALYPRSRVRVSRSGTRPVVTVRNPARVQVTAAGKTTQVTAISAADALKRAGLRADGDDHVTWKPGTVTGHTNRTDRPAEDPATSGTSTHTDKGPTSASRNVSDALATTWLTDGDRLRLVRVTRHVTRTQTKIPAPVRRIRTAALPEGTRHIDAAGKAGVRVTALVQVRRDGQVVQTRRHLVRHVRPTARIVRVGTGPIRQASPPAVPRTVPGPPPAADRQWPRVPVAEGRDWAALAHCESSGNPRAHNPAGYWGLYQFDESTWASVGGVGNPAHASGAEQTYRAKLLFSRRGAQPWPVCGRLL